MTTNPYEREYRELEDLGVAPPIPERPEEPRLISTESESLLYKHQRTLRREGYDPQLNKPLAEDAIVDQEEADREFMRSLDNVPKPKPRSVQAREWLLAQAAAENARFLGELITVRSDRSATTPDTGYTQSTVRVSPETLTDAQVENAAFQRHIANYDPNLFRRGRRRKVEWDRPTGPRPATVTDAAAADAAFFRGLRNWSPG